jgi:Tfp pilus assembly protein PilF
VTQLTASLRAESKNGASRQRLAAALFHLGKTAEAQKEFERAAKDDTTLEPAALSMARMYVQQDERDKAAEWFNHAARQHPKTLPVRTVFAAWLIDQGRFDEAKEQVAAAAEFATDSREFKMMRGLVGRYLKDYVEAERFFQDLYNDQPADFPASNQLALVLLEQSDEAKRRRALQLAEVNARQYPQSAEALSTLGWVYYRLGRLDEAERLLQAVIAAGRATSDTAYFLAHVLTDRGRLDDARKLLSKALEAKGSFVHRTEARQWLERISEKPSETQR